MTGCHGYPLGSSDLQPLASKKPLVAMSEARKSPLAGKNLVCEWVNSLLYARIGTLDALSYFPYQSLLFFGNKVSETALWSGIG